jgi:hypothetical protein
MDVAAFARVPLCLAGLAIACGCGPAGVPSGTPDTAAAESAEDEEAAIGVARMEQDGTIVLTLRAEGPHGEIGDGLVVYPPSHEDYQYVLDHLGGLQPGREKVVRPFPPERPE